MTLVMLILRKLCKALIISSVLTISSAWAQTDANGLYQAERWAEALVAYTAVVAADLQAVAAYPCEHDEAFSAFDFWIGEWEVHDASGTYAGSNVIERAERGCVLIEHWSSASGGSGMSINYLDKASGEWVQVWNDASGSQINIRGGMTEEGMLLVGTIHYVSSDSTLPFRGLWTLLPDGRVRQFFETSEDDGASWTSWFEGFYTRKSVD